MKKLIYIICVVVISTTFINAQTNDFIPRSSFGIKQGVNFSSVNFSPRITQGLTLGYTGGVVYKYQNERSVGLQVELNYIQKGWTEDLDTINNSYSRKLDYIELPFITHIVLGKRSLKYYINLGTAFAYLISETEDIIVNNELYRRDYYESDIEKHFEYSGLAELGVLLNTNIGDFQVGVRYQLSLTDLFETTSESTFSQSQSSVFGVSLTYFINSNK